MGLCSLNQPQGCQPQVMGLTCPSPALPGGARLGASVAPCWRPVLTLPVPAFPSSNPSAVGGVSVPSGGLQCARGCTHSPASQVLLLFVIPSTPHVRSREKYEVIVVTFDMVSIKTWHCHLLEKPL